MRHGKKVAKLGRTSAHRKAMLGNMAASLILHKRIKTTVAKAKALRKFIEPLLTRAKLDTTHSRRMVFRKVNDKQAVKELFDIIAKQIADRPGGYTRILRIGNRLGDNAEMCIIELVDYNETYSQSEGKTKKRKRRRTRRGSSGSGGGDSQSSNKKQTQVESEETTSAVNESATDTDVDESEDSANEKEVLEQPKADDQTETKKAETEESEDKKDKE